MPDREAAIRRQPDRPAGRAPAYLLIVRGEYVLAGESAGPGRGRSSTHSRFSISTKGRPVRPLPGPQRRDG